MCLSQVRSQASGVAGTINVFRDQGQLEEDVLKRSFTARGRDEPPGLLAGSQQACSTTCSADAG